MSTVQQPAWVNAQSNLRLMLGEVLQWNPDLPASMAIQNLNNRLRKVIDRRVWAGLLVKSQIIVPDQTTTGTITATRNSQTVTGAATAWPVNDLVSTTLSIAITETGYLIDITPTSMTGIGIGDWLTLDAGNAGEEQVLVVGLTTTTFRAICSKTHLVAVTITKSSLVRQQFRVVETAPWYTIIGVSSATQLIIDQVYGGVTVAGASYSIFLGYVAFGNDCKYVHEVANLNRRYRLGCHIPQGAINAYDPQRSAVESSYLLVDYVVDEIGRPRYELYPRPTSAQVFMALYYRLVPPLSDDEDTPPSFIRSDVLVMGAIADALRFRPKANRYYDAGTALRLADTREVDFEREVQNMIEADDAVYMQNLIWEYSRWPLGSYGADWLQSHDVGIMMGNI